MDKVTVIGMEQAMHGIYQEEVLAWIFGLGLPLMLLSVTFFLLREEEIQGKKIVGWTFSSILAMSFAYVIMRAPVTSQTAKEIFALQDRTDQIEKVYVSEHGAIAVFGDGSCVECKGWKTMKNPSGDGSIILDVEHKRVLY